MKNPPPGAVMLGGSTALWHPWKDKPGLRHVPTRWHKGAIHGDLGALVRPASAEEAIQYVGRNQLYVFCNDILDANEFAFSKELVEHDRSEAYMQKTGRISALRVYPTRTSGFFIPASTWLYQHTPTQEFTDSVRSIFARFGYEAISPASASEKVLRSTLPYTLYIHRPASELRSVLLLTNGGGRIDLAEMAVFFPIAFSYDINKAYLSFSRLVPSPFGRVWRHYHPKMEWLYAYPTGYWKVTMTVHGQGVHPIYLEDKTGKKRKPVEGETFTKWLWTGTITDCIAKGYTLEHIHQGYGFSEMSDFMSKWVDIIWDSFSHDDGELCQQIKKTMAVGLPGRFLKQPEYYRLIPLGQQKKGDVPIKTNWQEGGPYLTDFYVRAEYDKESTALTPIGAYIIEECRRSIYHAQLEEMGRDNVVLRSYVDSITFSRPAKSLDTGTGLGQFKEKLHIAFYAEENRYVGQENGEVEPEMKAPGYGIESRIKMWQRYRRAENA